MGLTIVMWLASCTLLGKWPKVNPVGLGCVVLLLIQGWWMVFNAKGEFRPVNSQLVEIVSLWPVAPGSVERGLSLASMQRLSGLLLILCFVSDFARRPLWRIRLWRTIGLTGTSIVLFGLIERGARAPMIFWESDRQSDTFFATYVYHANAGAYINLVLPLIAGLAAHSSLRKRRGAFALAFWIGAVLITLAGAFVNFSRGAQFITVVLLLIMGAWQLRWNLRESVSPWKRWPRYAGFAAIVLLPIGLLWETSTSARWARFGHEAAEGRIFAAQVTSRMAEDAGLFGFGPGTFRLCFPFYITEAEKLEKPAAAAFWHYAHNDYLQTAAEWGWVGSTFWALLFGGGIMMGLRTYLRSKYLFRSEDRILLFTSTVALVGVAFHALFDFPLQIASLQLYTSVYLGLLWGSADWLRKSKENQLVASAVQPETTAA